MSKIRGKIDQRVRSDDGGDAAGKFLLKSIFLMIVLSAVVFGFGSSLMRGQLP